MYKYRIITIRSDTSTPWYTKDSATTNHIQTTYYQPGIMSSNNIVESSDDTIKVIEVTFTDWDAYVVFRSDPIVSAYIEDRNAYEAINGIVRFREDIE